MTKAQREADEQARQEAEAKARRVAEAKARREAEARARRETEEAAQRQWAEARARREAETKAQRQARREAEAKAQRETEAKAQREWQQAIHAAEETRREAEEPSLGRGTAALVGTSEGDIQRRIAGALTILSALLLVIGLFPNYTDYSLADPDSERPGLWVYVLTMTLLALAAGTLMFLPPTRRLIGPGLLLGAAFVSMWGIVYLLSDITEEGFEDLYAGYWLELAAHLVLVVPAFLVGAALVKDDEVRLVRRPQGSLSWLLIVLGSVSALALLFQLVVYLHYGSYRDYGSYLDYSYSDRAAAKASVAAIVMALLVPAWAAVAVPRRIGVSLLACWIVGAVGISISSYFMLLVNAWSALFTLTLLGLLVVAIYFGGAEARTQDRRPDSSPLSR